MAQPKTQGPVAFGSSALLALQPRPAGAMTQETSLSSTIPYVGFSAAGGGTYTGLPPFRSV